MRNSRMKTFLFFIKDASKEKPIYPVMFILQALVTGLFPFVNLYLSKYLLDAFARDEDISKLAILGAVLVGSNLIFKCVITILVIL